MGNFIKSKQVKTRKEHSCFGCGRKFPKGSKLTASTSSDFDGIQTTYWCNVCLEYWSRYMETNDEIMFGELRSEDKNGWEKVKEDVIDS